MAQTSKLSKKDICDIIKTIGKSSITHFEYDGLKILRDDEDTKISKTGKARSVCKEIPESYLSQKEYEHKTDELGTMHIEDPVAYEEMMARNELIDKVGSNGKA